MAPFVRPRDELKASAEVLQAFKAAGFDPIPLKHFYSKRQTDGAPNGNTPRDKGWVTNDYSRFDFYRWMKEGGNVGFRLQADQLVVDVDVRNGGLSALAQLQFDCPDLKLDGPSVLSGRGDGGRHYYFLKPMALRVRTLHKGLKGIDFKHGPGGYVVAPGSLHYLTGKPYVAKLGAVPQAPESLLSLIEKPAPTQRRGVGGEFTPAQLARMLAVLDPADFGADGPYHDEWVNLAAACHDAVAGDEFEGMDAWLDWNASDSRYDAPEHRHKNEQRWRSFEAGRPGGVTFRTLLRAVARAGHKDLVAALSVRFAEMEYPEDFVDDGNIAAEPPRLLDPRAAAIAKPRFAE